MSTFHNILIWHNCFACDFAPLLLLLFHDCYVYFIRLYQCPNGFDSFEFNYDEITHIHTSASRYTPISIHRKHSLQLLSWVIGNLSYYSICHMCVYRQNDLSGLVRISLGLLNCRDAVRRCVAYLIVIDCFLWNLSTKYFTPESLTKICTFWMCPLELCRLNFDIKACNLTSGFKSLADTGKCFQIVLLQWSLSFSMILLDLWPISSNIQTDAINETNVCGISMESCCFLFLSCPLNWQNK